MERKNVVCPWWLGYVLLFPARKLWHNPYKILSNYVKEGMNVLDFGCAMGYFSIPMAQMTGPEGSVYCVDIQEKMLNKLQQRARKKGVENIIKPILAGKTFNAEELKNTLDFALLFFVVHEVRDQVQLFNDIYKMLKPGGKVLFSEPAGHVTNENFEDSLSIAKTVGFIISEDLPRIKGLSVLLVK